MQDNILTTGRFRAGLDRNDFSRSGAKKRIRKLLSVPDRPCTQNVLSTSDFYFELFPKHSERCAAVKKKEFVESFILIIFYFRVVLPAPRGDLVPRVRRGFLGSLHSIMGQEG